MIEVVLTDDLAACHIIRRVVFIEEQGVPEAEEVDGRDGEALQFLARQDGRVVGTGRVLLSDNVGKIGRVAVLKEARGAGVGLALIRAAMAEIKARGLAEARLGSQTSAVGFYERIGFVAEGPEFIDAGIPHREMVAAL